jgi:hypothetical protein
MNVAMVKKDQVEVDVCVTTRGQRARILEVDMLVEEVLEKELSPTKGCRIKWGKEKLIHKDVVNELQRIQEVEDRPLEMCMDVPFDLKLIKLIIQPTGLNDKELL